jgi:hypothetical protein
VKVGDFNDGVGIISGGVRVLRRVSGETRKCAPFRSVLGRYHIVLSFRLFSSVVGMIV